MSATEKHLVSETIAPVTETFTNAETQVSGNEVLTFGCRLNAYESEVIRKHLHAAGRENVVVVNSCAVTQEAERQVRQSIRKLRRERPDAEIIVTGCAAQVHPEVFAAMPEVTQVLGNEEKMQPDAYLKSGGNRLSAFGTERVRVNDIMSVQETALHLVEGLEGKSRAFIQVQNGCNHRCTFCIIPYGRGNSRSVPAGEVVNQIRQLVQRGYKEIVLTGVDVSDYGQDLPGKPTLGNLCARILKLVPELPRLRLSSIDAVEVDADVLQLLRDEPRFMPHLHLSLQAGDDMILKRMKRRHLREDALRFCLEARKARPDIVFGADIIAGFPTETEEMFQQSMKIVEECNLTYLHVFPYSEREGTPAAKMPQVAKAVRKERAERLRQLGERQLQQFLHSRVGTMAQVLMEQDGLGRTEHFAPVRCVEAPIEGGAPVESLLQGSLVYARIMGVEGSTLLAKVEAV